MNTTPPQPQPADTPDNDAAVDRWLRTQHQAMLDDVREQLDISAGLAEVLLATKYADLRTATAKTLDVDAGLTAILSPGAQVAGPELSLTPSLNITGNRTPDDPQPTPWLRGLAALPPEQRLMIGGLGLTNELRRSAESGMELITAFCLNDALILRELLDPDRFSPDVIQRAHDLTRDLGIALNLSHALDSGLRRGLEWAGLVMPRDDILATSSRHALKIAEALEVAHAEHRKAIAYSQLIATLLVEALSDSSLWEDGPNGYHLNRHFLKDLGETEPAGTVDVNPLAHNLAHNLALTCASARAREYDLDLYRDLDYGVDYDLGPEQVHKVVARLAQMIQLLSDVRGADLREANLIGVPLGGVRWNADTQWPPDLHDRIVNDSVPIEDQPDVFIVRSGTTFAFL
jgi:hypothetical protein